MGQTDFNLDQAIANHILLIQQKGSTTDSDLAELKAHLYDAFEELKSNGLNPEEAFMVARHRLGDTEILTNEYSKVNPSVQTNKLWAYLFLGVALLANGWTLLRLIAGGFYLLVFKNYHTTVVSSVMVVLFHIALIVLVFYLVKKKHNISRFLERQVDINPIKTVLLAFIPLCLTIFIPRQLNFEMIDALRYPIYKFDNDYAEFSLYLLGMSMSLAALSIIFSLKNVGHISLKSLLANPSILLLLIFGFSTELLASTTRIFNNLEIISNGFIFGFVYLLGSFLISYHNVKGDLLKNLITFSIIGLVLETSVGIMADIDRGFSLTGYFVSSLILGVIIGAFLGIKMKPTELEQSVIN